MNVQETLAVIEALRLAGATHFKSQDFEITMGEVPRGTISKPLEVSQEQTKATAEANQKITELINTMKMTPEQLADQIFPAGAGG
jgi:hypothetical protein